MSVSKIDLGNGIFTIVDTKNVVWLCLYGTWCVDSNNYPCCSKKNKKTYMHILIAERMNLKGEIDHKNRNPLDNREENLREATRSQNNVNCDRISQSKFRGVKKHGNGWQARIRKDGVEHQLGTYVIVEDAAKAYDKAAKEMFGKFARLNFPEK